MQSLVSLVAAAQFLSLQEASAFQTPLTQRLGVSLNNRHESFGFIASPNNQRHRSPLYAASENETDEKKTTTTPSAATEDNKPSSNPFKLYTDYFDRLWSDTDVDQRQKLANRRAKDAILQVKNMVSSSSAGAEYLFEDAATKDKSSDAGSADADGKEGAVFADLDEGVRRKMEVACDLMLEQLMEKGSDMKRKSSLPFGKKGAVVGSPAAASSSEESTVLKSDAVAVATEESSTASDKEAELTKALIELSDSTATPTATTETTKEVEATPTPAKEVAAPKKKKGGRSVLFGLSMGLTVAAWVYSGNYIFTALFTLMTALGQLEYYRMAMHAGIYPARRISVMGACAMFVTALFAPDLHQICLPVASTMTMIWFLTMRRSITTISEIATTFTGMFYLGYIPSFWVRIRQLGPDLIQPTRLAPLTKPLLDYFGQKKLPAFLPKTIQFPITTGANFIFWTWLCIAFSDVGGYFAGRKFGKTKLGAISPAAGKTSPNKTVEGVIGGCAFSMFLATLGAWNQNWPYWMVLGPAHGVILALLGLVGDLTASMLKRDAGLKDFGDLIPEHGGIMDRVDSYIFTAPY